MSRIVLFGKAVVSAPGKVNTNAFVEVHDGKVYKLTNFSGKPDISADVIMPGFIDPHVHCRDWNQREKETIRTACAAAAHGGVTRIHDMPNTDPPVLTQDDVVRRIEDAAKSSCPVEYGLYVGVTDGPGQIRQAAEAVSKYPQVMGLKMYAGESTGGMALSDPDDQLMVYKVLASAGYKGVLMVHCEKESLFKGESWSVNNPETWCALRPPESETESVREQIELAVKAGFKGHLHVCHATVPETAKIIAGSPSTLSVSCGLSPHHALLSSESMRNKSRGLYYKVNPPLRSAEDAMGMVKALISKRIDWIETDHAPHRLAEKLNHPYLSGVPGLDNYANFATLLNAEHGIPFADMVGITSFNAAAAFELGDRSIKAGNPANLTLIDMAPEKFDRRSVKSKCGWSPYEGMTFPGRCKATLVNGQVAYLEK